jgi:hypothetical protein
MSQYTPPNFLRVRGEVVETFEKDGRRFARIVLKPGCIEACIDTLEETHLGDQVLVDLDITVLRIQPEDTVAGSEFAADL